MDLTLFHHTRRPYADYRFMDRRNSRTGSICYYLELIGWYDTTAKMRFLGHYRLFQLCKNHHAIRSTGLSLEKGYILYYRETGILKHSWIQRIPFHSLLANRIDRPEIQTINRILLEKRPEILQNFLVAAQTDFEKALRNAMDQINDPAFLSEAPITNVHVEINQNHQHNTTLAKNELHIHPIIKEETPPPAKGKEKDIFSKKQILILFDLLTKTGKTEPIDFKNPKKFEAVAHLLRAITGKGEDSWREELNNYRPKDLYAWHSNGERLELIRTLINLVEKFEIAGFQSIVQQANKKIIELEHAAP